MTKIIFTIFGITAILGIYMILKGELGPQSKVLNPGDPTEVIVWRNIEKADPRINWHYNGATEVDGSKIHLKTGYEDRTLMHEFCHLTDRCGGDPSIALNRVKGLPIEVYHVLNELVSEQKTLPNGIKECLWVTLQRKYTYDVILHQEIKDALNSTSWYKGQIK